MIQMKLFIPALVICTLVTWVPAAQAATTAITCSVQTTPLSFGSYLGNALTSTATITTSCNQVVPVQVQMSKGSGSSLSNRAMKSGGNNMNYNLYTDASYQVIWGDGTGGTQIQTGTNLTVYGQIPASQNVAPGNYSDTIVVTITW